MIKLPKKIGASVLRTKTPKPKLPRTRYLKTNVVLDERGLKVNNKRCGSVTIGQEPFMYRVTAFEITPTGGRRRTQFTTRTIEYAGIPLKFLRVELDERYYFSAKSPTGAYVNFYQLTKIKPDI